MSEATVPETEAPAVQLPPAHVQYWRLFMWWVAESLIGVGVCLRMPAPLRQLLLAVVSLEVRARGRQAVIELRDYQKRMHRAAQAEAAHAADVAKAQAAPGKGRKSRILLGDNRPVTRAERELLDAARKSREKLESRKLLPVPDEEPQREGSRIIFDGE